MILNIETSTGVCSVSVSSDSSILSYRESGADRSHAALLTIFIEEAMKESGKDFTDLSAVAVSKGPGSYTGLRIGVSTAKGICYGADLPLIAVDTLQTMALGIIRPRNTGLINDPEPQRDDTSGRGNGRDDEPGDSKDKKTGNRRDYEPGKGRDDESGNDRYNKPGKSIDAKPVNSSDEESVKNSDEERGKSIDTAKLLAGTGNDKILLCPMIDARRMEVYTAMYDTGGKQVSEIHASVIDESSFRELLGEKMILFFGDGADKCRGVLSHRNAVYVPGIHPSALQMAELSHKAFHEGRFEDVALFEPFYLKDFITTTPKKNIL